MSFTKIENSNGFSWSSVHTIVIQALLLTTVNEFLLIFTILVHELGHGIMARVPVYFFSKYGEIINITIFFSQM